MSEAVEALSMAWCARLCLRNAATPLLCVVAHGDERPCGRLALLCVPARAGQSGQARGLRCVSQLSGEDEQCVGAVTFHWLVPMSVVWRGGSGLLTNFDSQRVDNVGVGDSFWMLLAVS